MRREPLSIIDTTIRPLDERTPRPDYGIRYAALAAVVLAIVGALVIR